MVYDYFLSTLRVIVKNRLFSAINIISLTIGLAATILILLFVVDEFSYDRWVMDGERIYRVETLYSPIGRDPMSVAMSPGPALPALLEEFSEIEAGARMFFGENLRINQDGTNISEKVVYASDSVFAVFEDFLLEGNPETALLDNNSVVLTETMAQKYFPNGRAMGQTLILEDGETIRVTGIMRDMPHNTHLDIEIMKRFDEVNYIDYPMIAQEWRAANIFTYLKFKEGTDISLIEDRLPAMIDRRAVLTGYMADLDDRRSEAVKLNMVPFRNIYLSSDAQFQVSDWTGNFRGPGDGNLVYALSAIATFILGIAIMNYINLSTAMASRRAREVGLRKIVGADRKQIIIQFLTESVGLSLIALLAACALIELSLPYYNEFVGKELSLSFSNYFDVGFWLIGAAILVGLTAGFYPALYLSSFKPARTLANQASGSSSTGKLRSVLVITQFAISIGLIICTSILFAQTNFATTMDVGFTKENMVVIRGMGGDRYASLGETMKQELLNAPGVEAVGRSAAVPADMFEDNTRATFPDQAGLDPIPISELQVDPDFFASYQIEALAGRLLEWDRGADMVRFPEEENGEIPSASVVLNEAAVDHLGLGDAEAALGRTFNASVGSAPVSFTVIGVIRDFHFKSIHDRVNPYLMYHEPNRIRTLTVRLDGDNVAQSLAAIDRIWNNLVPDVAINRVMLEDHINNRYGDERRRGIAVMGFTILGTLIAAFGLFGLASFTADRRTKEIGIRKVFGARVRDVAMLLMWQFTRPALIANVIAWPVAYYYMRGWLDGFAYRIDMGTSFFVTASAVALVVAWITVLYHVLRVARANPIHALRYE